MALSQAASRPSFDGSSVRTFFANGLVLASFPILIGLYLVPSFFGQPLVPNVIGPAIAIIVLSTLFVGVRAFTVTTFDYLFFAWVGLAVASHIYANAILTRGLPDSMLYLNVGFIVSMILMFRAVFCLSLVSPDFATRVFVATMIGFLSLAAVLGLMERFGPNPQAAINLASALAPVKAKVLEGATYGRPTSIFGGPNLLGFSDSVLTCFALGWGLTGIRRINYLKVMAVMALFAFATISALASQSRSTILLMAFFPLVFGIQLRRRAADQTNTALFAAFLAIGVLGVLYVLQNGRYDYLTSVQNTGIQNDLSYQVRVKALSQVSNVAADLAPLGSGEAQANNPHLEYTLGYDRYGTLGVDNEWANAYEGFGVWGPLFLIALFGVWMAYDARLRGDPRLCANLIFYTSAAFLVLILVLSPGAVRVMKYETAGFAYAILGCLAAWHTLTPRVKAFR
jgi:hypothetical protein